MTEQEKLQLLMALDALWACCDRHSHAGRILAILRNSWGLPPRDYSA